MKVNPARRAAQAVPVLASIALVLSACGSGGGNATAAQEAAPAAVAPSTTDAAAPDAAAAAPVAKAEKADAKTKAAPDTKTTTAADTPAGVVAPKAETPSEVVKAKPNAAAPAAPAKSSGATKVDRNSGQSLTVLKGGESAAQKEANQKIYDAKNGATEVGVSKEGIKLGSINMHGMALGNIITQPQVRAMAAAAEAINDRGGVLGRRISIQDCDDGPGEVARAKACLKKLAGQDHIFSLITGIDWATASIHDDLKQFGLPYIGAWAYSQTEWQDPFMFPTHMSMIHEAMSGAHWAANVVKPKTYGLICLTSPEMQLACNAVTRIMDASGSKLVKRADVSISETSMAAYVLAMRAAAPEHIIHYVINPATIAKFVVESQQQGYYPPKGLSGNHLAAEVLGSLFGQWPAGRYWTNTTYRMWGAEYWATMTKYARGNRGLNHHITQAGYVGMNIFAQAATEVGPNLTRDRLMAVLGNGTVWASDADMDQKFQWVNAERTGDNWNHEYGQGREFIYKYMSSNTAANPDGSPNGWTPDPDQFVIYTWK
jgi:ABC-type branched-subunit amino acid transport system substrate-binding protein